MVGGVVSLSFINGRIFSSKEMVWVELLLNHEGTKGTKVKLVCLEGFGQWAIAIAAGGEVGIGVGLSILAILGIVGSGGRVWLSFFGRRRTANPAQKRQHSGTGPVRTGDADSRGHRRREQPAASPGGR